MIYVLNANLSLWLCQFEGLHTNLSGSIKAITCASRENGKSMKSAHQLYKIQNEKYKIKIQKTIQDIKYSVVASWQLLVPGRENEKSMNTDHHWRHLVAN